jgi:hypothetical protein
METPRHDDDRAQARPGARDRRSWAGVWRWFETSVPRAGVVINAAASTRKVSMSMVMARAASCRAVCV